MESTLPTASYFNSGTAAARKFVAEVELIASNDRYELYRRKSDSTYWRLDSQETFQQRFLIQLDQPETWTSFDSSPQEKQLLLERRGGTSSEQCRWQDCGAAVLVGSAFCVDHAYEMGARK